MIYLSLKIGSFFGGILSGLEGLFSGGIFEFFELELILGGDISGSLKTFKLLAFDLQ